MTDRKDALEFVRVEPRLEKKLAFFFEIMREDEPFFHPHPLTAAAARDICSHEGLDLYYVALEADRIVAYGMLRGWDEGYDVPSLGIAVNPDTRRCGLGDAFLHFLHIAARFHGAKRVRLTVEPGNDAALSFYRRNGYDIALADDGRYLGFLDV